MKKINLALFLLLSLLVLNTACKKDDGDDGINVGGDSCTASWTVNNVDYEEDLNFCVYLNNVLNLGASATGGDFQLQIDPITANGTYTADPQNQDLSVYVTIVLDDGTQIGSSNATVRVTEISSAKAKGTFSGDFFDVTDLNQAAIYSVTQGNFSANF